MLHRKGIWVPQTGSAHTRAMENGDTDLARSLIADDAVYLAPGAGEIDKEMAAVGATAAVPGGDFDLDSRIREIKVMGDHAMLWTHFTLEIIDTRTDQRSMMAGHTLSILERTDDGGWVAIRDANTAAPVPTPATRAN